MKTFQRCLYLLLLTATDLVVAANYYFYPLTYDEVGGWALRQDTPQQACTVYAQVWGWDRAPFSFTFSLVNPGRWKCQRYYNGTLEPTQYTWILGRCQKDPVPLSNGTGTDWDYPTYDEYRSPSCRCNSPKIFDRGVEWCTASPSCLFYPDNKASGCGKTVDDLINASPPPTDPTSIFHSNQTCIARKSCDARCKMDNCKWLNQVIPTFVSPYLQKAAKWPAIEAKCRSGTRNWFNDRVCAESMARNHIFNDLLPSVVSAGCGSESDWAQVFGIISQCTQQTFGSSIERTLATAPVYLYRQAVRASCITARSSAGLDPAINLELKGKSCTP